MQDDRLRASLGNAIVRVFRMINRLHNRNLKPTGVSAEQAHVLSILWELGPMTMGQLQRLLALSSATLTGAIDRMADQELVRRVPSPDDRRAYVLEPLVPPKKRTQIEGVLDDGEHRCFDVLTAAERKELLRLLDKCAAHLEKGTSQS
jgi:MarR family 2-MHQ and catechol resistance regulon transcriptional repressor